VIYYKALPQQDPTLVNAFVGEVLQVTIALPKDLNGNIEKFRHVLGVTASM
jgi:hypothetical protein